MSDNTTLNLGSGGDVISTDDISGVKVQRVKVQYGTDGSATDVSDSNPLPIDDAGGSITVDGSVSITGDVSVTGTVAATQSGNWTARVADGSGNGLTSKAPGSERALSVAIVDGSGNQVTSFGGSGGTSATDDSAFTAASGSGTPMMGFATSDSVESGDVGVVAMTTGRAMHVQVQNSSMPVTDNGGSLTVDGTVAATQSGTWNVGTVTAVTAISNALPAGTNNIGDVDVLSIVPGTGATNLGKAEDAAHASGDTGVMALAVRRDADTALVGADGDYAPLQVNSSGSLKVAITAGAGSGGTSIADGASFTRDTTSITPAGAVVETSAPTLTNGDVAGLSMTTGGALRVAVSSGGVSGVVEDAAASDGVEGIAIMAVRRDSATSGVSADGDYAMLSVTSDGSLRVAGSAGTTQYTEDAASAGAESLCLMGAVRRDTAASSSGTDGDYSTLNTDANGRLHVIAALAASQTLATVSTVTSVTAIGTSVTPGTSAGHLGKAEDAAHASGDTGVAVLAVRRDTAAHGVSADGDYATLNVNSAGRLWASATIDAALPAGTNAIGTVTAVGTAAHDAAISGNPVRMAARAASSDYTAVAAGDTADLVTSLTGKQIVLPYALPGASWAYASPSAVTDTSDDQVIAAGAAGVRHYIAGIQVFNSHASTGTEVVIKDGSTVLWRGWAQPTGGGCSAKFDPPLRGTAATAVNVANITTSSSTYFNLQGYSAAE